MNCKHFVMLIITFAIISLFITNSYAQDYSKGKNVTASFSILGTESFVDKLDTYTPATSREKEKAKNFNTAFEAQISNLIYEKVVAEMQTKEIEMLPLNTLTDEILYGSSNFPVLLIPKKKIKKMGSKDIADYFFVFNVNVGDAIDLASIALSKSATPKITINIKVFDKAGNMLKKGTGEIKGDRPIKSKDFVGKRFDKLDGDYIEPLLEYLTPTIDKAAAKAVAGVTE